MRTKKIKTDIINNRVKEHKKYKLQLLKLIDEMPNVSQGGVSKVIGVYLKIIHENI